MNELVDRLRRGDEEAYRELYAAVQKKLLYYVYRLTGNPDDTQEIVQETFTRVYTRIDSLKDPGLLVHWIYRIASNLSVNRLKRRNLYAPAPPDESAGRTKDGGNRRASEDGRVSEDRWASEDRWESEDRWVSAEDIVMKKYDRELVTRALLELNASYREVLILHYINGRPYKDIAAILSLGFDQVRGRLYHARKALQRRITSLEAAGGGVLS